MSERACRATRPALVQQPSQSNEIKLVSLSDHLDSMNDITYTIKIKRVLSRTDLVLCLVLRAEMFQIIQQSLRAFVYGISLFMPVFFFVFLNAGYRGY